MLDLETRLLSRPAGRERAPTFGRVFEAGACFFAVLIAGAFCAKFSAVKTYGFSACGAYGVFASSNQFSSVRYSARLLAMTLKLRSKWTSSASVAAIAFANVKEKLAAWNSPYATTVPQKKFSRPVFQPGVFLRFHTATVCS